MAREKQIAGSPFTGTTTVTRSADLSRARLVATGGAVTVRLSGISPSGVPLDLFTLEAEPGNPDDYVSGGGADKLHFETSLGITFEVGAGKLYLFET
jgi:hypothetical protein